MDAGRKRETLMKHIEFQDKNGSFIIHDPENYSGLYLPMAGEKGLKSSITPNLGGDSKTDQNHFLLEPVSIENLHNNRNTRNFWCQVYKTQKQVILLCLEQIRSFWAVGLSVEILQNRNFRNLQISRTKAHWKLVLCGRRFPENHKNMVFRQK
mgnify:FL=1